MPSPVGNGPAADLASSTPADTLADHKVYFARDDNGGNQFQSLDDVLRINFGPNHPSTHGVLRLVVDLDGETVVGVRAVIGYLHTGFEKTMEHKTYWKGITYPERIDYLSFQANELVFVLAIEKLLGIEVPRKATWMRMCLTELNRIHSHLVWLGTGGLELGAIVHCPRVLAVAHIMTLGVITTSIFGVLYQFYPMALGAGARSLGNFRNSDFWLFSSNRFNLSKVQLNYNFSEKLVRNTFFRDLGVFVSSANLFTFSPNREILDLSVATAPQLRSFNIGARAKF